MLRLIAILSAITFGAIAADAAQPISFQRDIRPLLSDRCFHCHGPDPKTRQADLRLDLWESASTVIDVAAPVNSRLLQRVVSHDPAEIMPPPEIHKPLDENEIQKLKLWIEQGASWQQHWAYDPPQQWTIPNPTQASWSTNWIDHFVLEKLQQQQLQPSADAEAITLLRRICFDLTGLPPTADLLHRWQRSRLDYAQVVDELLVSPQYGERMAMYWLDLVRYADTVGYHGDQEHAISAYRQWVVEAFNAGMPFDQMTREQLAGDLLPNATTKQRIATGYNRLLQTTHEGGLQPKEYRAIYAADRVRNVSSVWLASTMGCAQCHDHKFDPLTMNDFYSLSAFFADIDDEGHFVDKTGLNDLPTNRAPELELPTEAQSEQISELQTKIQRLKAMIAQDQTASKDSVAVNPPDISDSVKAQPTENSSLLVEQLKQAESQLAVAKKVVRRSMITVALSTPRPTRILPRGNWLDESGPLVEPSFPAFLNSVIRQEKSAADRRLDRLDLANWLVDADQGVGLFTARVIVNRLWYLMFGTGLARSLDEFGSQGEPPSHPELLDNLAHYLIENSWDLRAPLRLMALSRTYQQASQATPENLERDNRNQWYARQNANRLPAEMIRDNALMVSGLLVQNVGGDSARPYQPAGYYKLLNFPERDYTADLNENQWRRGLYMHWQRQFLHPMLKAFDATSREECTAQRPRSNTPLSALTLLNDPTFVEAARVLAQRILASTVDGGMSDAARINRLFNVVLQREAKAEEIDILLGLLGANRQHYVHNRQSAEQLLAVGIHWRDESLDAAELATWTQLCRAVLNLAETTTRY